MPKGPAPFSAEPCGGAAGGALHQTLRKTITDTLSEEGEPKYLTCVPCHGTWCMNRLNIYTMLVKSNIVYDLNFILSH